MPKGTQPESGQPRLRNTTRSVKSARSGSERENSTVSSLRRIRLLLEVMTHAEGMTRDELLALPDLRPLYGAHLNAAQQRIRRDLEALAGAAPRKLRQHSQHSQQHPASSAHPTHPAMTGVSEALLRYDAATERYTFATQDVALMRLSRAELEALCCLGYAFQGGQTLLGGRELFRRLAAALPEDQRRVLGEVLTGNTLPPSLIKLDLRLPILEDAQIETLHLLQRALHERRTVDFEYLPTYRSGDGPLSPTAHRGDTVEEIRADAAHVYVEVWCEDARLPGLLDLRLERFVVGSVKLQPTLTRQHPRHFPLVKYWLSPRIAQGGITERLEQQQVEIQQDGSAIVSGQARSLFWARQLLLKYGDHAQALEPETLVNEMRHTVERMAQVYRIEER